MTDTIARPAHEPVKAPVVGGRARITVGIIGATGYVGGELIRLLERHPLVSVADRAAA